METAISRDGTPIAYSRVGKGPSLVLVDGALCYRASGPSGPLAAQLADHFTVFTYDRRGRGESGNTAAPDSVGREVEDLGAVIAAAGGSAFVYGVSSARRLRSKRLIAVFPSPGSRYTNRRLSSTVAASRSRATSLRV